MADTPKTRVTQEEAYELVLKKTPAELVAIGIDPDVREAFELFEEVDDVIQEHFLSLVNDRVGLQSVTLCNTVLPRIRFSECRVTTHSISDLKSLFIEMTPFTVLHIASEHINAILPDQTVFLVKIANEIKGNGDDQWLMAA